MEKISDRILRLRNLKRLTQGELSKKINVSDKVISKWECGESLPNIEDLSSLSKFFRVSMDYLVKGIANQSDKNVLNTKYRLTTEELNDEIKNTCMKILKENNLIKYKDLLLDDVKFNNGAAGSWYNYGVFYVLRVLEGPKNKGWDDEILSENHMYFVDANSVFELNNYSIFKKLNKLNMITDLRNPFQSRFKGITLKQLTDLNITDIGFYDFITNPSTEDLDLALENLITDVDEFNPKIIKCLLDKGACIRKVLGLKGVGIDGYAPIYGKDVFATLQLKDYVEKIIK